MKKMCRLAQERKIAGICSGLGQYFQLDPVLFRVSFIFLLFTGLGGLLYIVMWMVLPLKDDLSISKEIKRLYMLEGEKKLVGICAGLGQFFGVDPNIFRILFVVSTLAGGFGLFVYIIMAFILPRKS